MKMNKDLMESLAANGHITGPHEKPLLGAFVRSFFNGESLPVWARFMSRKELDVLEDKTEK